MKRAALLFLGLLAATSAMGADVTARIVGGGQVAAGEVLPGGKLLVLECTIPDVDVAWFVNSPGVDYEPAGNRLYIGLPCTDAVLNVNMLAVDFANDKFAAQQVIRYQIDGPCDDGPPPDDDDNPGPDPPPKPTPDVPPDAFGNVGQAVAAMAVQLPNNAQAAANYTKAAKALRTDPGATVNSVSAALALENKTKLDLPAYTETLAFVEAELNKRWPMSMGVLADYYTAVAAGFEAVR